ncbi:MAG: hypothetical protein Kow0059_13150 [Candidatus Sumerlaeia bacterium]
MPAALLPGAPAEVVTPWGSEFSLNGRSFRFVGVNIRGLCHYGKGDILPYTTAAHIDENLDGAAAFGCRVIRVFAPVGTATKEENTDRLKAVLDKMAARGQKAIVVLTDVYNTGFHPQGDDSYYQPQPGGWTLLDDTWFAGGYKINYKPWVEHAVGQLKDHTAVFCWELGNELTDIKTPANIISFTADMAATIKAIDPWHMVTTGFIGIDHTQIGEAAGLALYADPNIDFITQHSYDGSDQPQNHAVHSRLQKPLVLEEFGWNNQNSRAANTLAEVNRWFDERAARGFLQWGYQWQNYDIGDGDLIFGMDRHANGFDYDQLAAIYGARAAAFAANPPLLPARLEPRGENVAPRSIAWKADSSFSAAFEGPKAYDGVISAASKWTSSGGAPPHWLAIDLGREHKVDGVTVRMAGAAGEFISYNFTQYELQSGPSLDGPWATEFPVANPAQFSFLHHVYYDAPRTLRFLRLWIGAPGIDNYARLPEIEVYAVGDDGWLLR